jgi:hypothetical protein
VQLVADARDRAEPARPFRIITYLLSQAMYQLLEQLAIAAAAMPPDVYQQPIGVHHLSGIGQ